MDNALAVFFAMQSEVIFCSLTPGKIEDWISGGVIPKPMRFAQQVGSPATEAAENATSVANEDLQHHPRIALRLLLRYLGAFFARLGKSNRNRLLAAGHHAALAAFARAKRAALLSMHRALHALTGGLSVSCHYAPPFLGFRSFHDNPLKLWLSSRCRVRRHPSCKHA